MSRTAPGGSWPARSRTVPGPAGPPARSRTPGRGTGSAVPTAGSTAGRRPQDWAWLAHLGEQLDRLPEDWDARITDDDPLTTLVVEVTAALSEAGLPLHDSTGAGSALGGACLTPEPGLGGIVVTWRQHDRMSVDQVHGSAPEAAVQHAMNRALAEILEVRGLLVEPFANSSGYVVRSPL